MTIALAGIVLTFVLGIVLFFFPIPQKEFLKTYRFSARFLGISYLLYSSMTYYFFIIPVPNGEHIDYLPEYFQFSGLFISSFVGLVFSFSVLSLLNPRFNKKRNSVFIIHLSILLLFALCYFIFNRIEPDTNQHSFIEIIRNISKPIVMLRCIFFTFYLFQIVHFTVLFINDLKNYKASIRNFYSETGLLKLKWIKLLFIAGFTIGVMALVFQAKPSQLFELIFTVALNGFFVFLALYFINYKWVFKMIDPVVYYATEPKIEEKKLKKSSWEFYKKTIIERKLYLQEGLTIVELAEILHVSRNTLSFLINNEENLSFNRWINQLRIEEAISLMNNNPEYSFFDIALRIGYSEHSNFSREFKVITGKTPSSWKTALTV
jgi:AraC-like DNA-binding protein